jgi:uncharacterized protein
MSPKTEILIKMREHSDELKVYGVKNVGLFGSFARSRPKTSSDIDILVEFERGGKTFDNYMDLKFYLERLFHRKIDLVIKDALKTRIRDKVLSEVKYA